MGALPKTFTSTASPLPRLSSTSVSVIIQSARGVSVRACQRGRHVVRVTMSSTTADAHTCAFGRLRLGAFLHHAVQVTAPRRQLHRLGEAVVRVRGRRSGSWPGSSHSLECDLCTCASLRGQSARGQEGRRSRRWALARAKRLCEESSSKFHRHVSMCAPSATPSPVGSLPTAWRCLRRRPWRPSSPHSQGCTRGEVPLRSRARCHVAGLNAADSPWLHVCLARHVSLRRHP